MEKLKILVADDHTVVRMGLSALLDMQRDMHVVGQAKNGKEAVEEALRLKPDVVIMDLMMPVMDGTEATRKIREQLPKTNVVILTTYTTTDGIAAALDSGAKGAVFKLERMYGLTGKQEVTVSAAGSVEEYLRGLGGTAEY